MKQRTFTIKSMARCAAVLLAAVLLAGLCPVQRTYAANDDDVYNTMTVYRWHRVKSKADLPRVADCNSYPDGRMPFLLFWKNGDQIYYGEHDSDGDLECDDEDALYGTLWKADMYKPDPFDSSSDNDVFYSTDVLTKWRLRATGGEDSENSNALQYWIWFGTAMINGWDDFDWYWGKDYKNADSSRKGEWTWNIHTRDTGGKYSKEIGNDQRVVVYCNVKGRDTAFKHGGDKVYGQSDGDYDYPQFVMYWAERVTYSAITENYTICEGMVMNVDDGVILKDNVTLTVNPGGVLSIEGEFFNNGTIKNYGTIVLQKDACISSFAPTSSQAGTIINSGDQINVKQSVEKQQTEAENALKTMQNRYAELGDELEGLIAEATEGLAGAEEAVEEKLLESQLRQGLNLSEEDKEYSDPRALGRIIEELESSLEAKQDDLDKYVREAWQRYGKEELEAAIKELSAIEQATLKGDALDAFIDALIESVELPKEEQDALDNDIANYYALNLTPINTRLEKWKSIKGPADADGSRTDSLIDLQAIAVEKQEALDALTAEKAGLESSISIQEKTVAYLKENIASGRAADVTGEGNLLILENGHLTFKDADRAYLKFDSGAGMVCNGYVVAPGGIQLEDSKIHIRSKGALICEYILTKSITGFSKAEPSEKGTAKVVFDGMKECSNVNHCITVSGDYHIVVDGVLRYDDSPVYNVDTKQNVDIMEGRGAWTTKNAPNKYTADKDGNAVEIDSEGNTLMTRPDGTMVYTSSKTGTVTELRPDGTKIVTLKNKSSVETREDGSRIERYSNGSIKSATIYHSDGSVGIFDRDLDAIVTEWDTPNADGVVKRYDYDNGRHTDFKADGTVIYYSAEGYVERIDEPKQESGEEPTEPAEQPTEQPGEGTT